MSDEYNQQRFGYEYENQSASKEHINFWGGFYQRKLEGENTPAFPALISGGTPSFEFSAFFRRWDAGHYIVRWRVKLLKGHRIPNGLRFRVSVNYGAEEDAPDSWDVNISHEELKEREKGLLNLELEELVVVQPYEKYDMSGERQWATVVVTMSNCEGVEDQYFGLRVDYVKLIPFGGFDEEENDRDERDEDESNEDESNEDKSKEKKSNEQQGKCVPKLIVKKAMVPEFTIDAMTSPFEDPPPTIPIRRIAWSKDSTFLAALAIRRDTGYITVWDMKNDPSKPKPEDISILERKCAVGTVKHTGWAEFLEDLSIGLAISADGTQVAVYQEPMVGQWNDGSESINSAFPFHLLTLQTLPDPPQPKEDATGHVTVPDPPQPKEDATGHVTVPDPLQPKEDATGQVTVPDPLQPKEDATGHVTVPDPLQPKEDTAGHVAVQIEPSECKQSDDNSAVMTYKPVELPHEALKNFVGFGAFLSGAYEEVEQSHSVLNTFIGYGSSLFGARGSDRDKDNSNAPQAAREDANDGKGGKEPTVDAQPSNSSRQSKSYRTLFAACNGIYIDVFKIKLGQKWRHTHSIGLTDLTPTISRRITCQMMMDTIGCNTFMWLEDGGVCCMLWNLRKGSNISYIAGPDNTKFGSTMYRGNSTMSISPDESMVALAGVDGTLTTFYASTGIAISSKKFTLCQIEYVAFTGHNNQLFVVIRDIMTLAFKSFILDPLQLNTSMPANEVPVPVTGRTILSYFRDECFKDKGIVCKTNGSKIHCYTAHEPVGNTVDIIDDNIVDSNGRHYPSLMNDQKTVAKNGSSADLTAETMERSTETPVPGLVPGLAPGFVQGAASEPDQGPMHGPMEGPKEDKKYEVRTAVDKERSRDDDDLMYWIIRVEVVESDLDGRNEKVIFSFVPEPWVNIPAAGFPHPKRLQQVYFLTEKKRFVVVGKQTLQVWSLPTSENDQFNLVFIWSRPRVNGDPEKFNTETITEKKQTAEIPTEKGDTKDTTTNSGKLGETTASSDQAAAAGNNQAPGTTTNSGQGADATAVNNQAPGAIANSNQAADTTVGSNQAPGTIAKKDGVEEKPSESKEDRKTADEKKAAAERKAAVEKETSSRKTIETELVGDYYHFIRKLHIHQNPVTGDAEAYIGLKGGSRTDVVSIPGEQGGNVNSTFFNCARSIHLLAASYAYSTQENKFLSALGKSSFTPKDHAEAIARFTRGHINRLLPSQHFYPLPLTDDVHASPKKASHEKETPTNTSPDGAPGSSSQPQNTPDPSTEQERYPDQTTPLYRGSTRGSTTTQQSRPTSPAQTLVQTPPLNRGLTRGSTTTQQSRPTSAQALDQTRPSLYRGSTLGSITTQQSRPSLAREPTFLRHSMMWQRSRPTSPVSALDLAMPFYQDSTQGSISIQYPTSPGQGPDPRRGSAIAQSNVGRTRNILVALGGNPSTDHKLQEQSHSSLVPSASITEDQRKNGLASFMDAQWEKIGGQKDEDPSPDDIFTVLTLLLDQSDLKDANHVFIEGLFKTEGHEWVPHPSVKLNPIERMIKIRNERSLKVLLGYCVKNAKKLHPGYLTPVIQCLSELSECHSDIVSDLFRKASYIPARNPKYVASNAIVANLRFSDWTNFKRGLSRVLNWIKRWWFRLTNSSDTPNDKDLYIYHYEKPVFSLRSQLPFHNHMGIISTALRLDLSRRKKRFPQGKNMNQQPTTMHQSMDIYVSPFQFKPTKGLDGRRKRSFLAEIAGKGFFDSPVMEASLWYTWNKSGLYFWSAHFIVLLIFFISVLTVTGHQIHVSKLPLDGSPPTAEQIAARYLPGWQPAFYLTITIGLLLAMYELLQLRFSTWQYFFSPYNYVHLAAYITPVIGCIISLNAKPTVREDTGIDGGPSQVWILAFAIILIYLNIIFELRIIKPLGRAVNIIVNIAKKIIWFLVIFAVFLMSFTHALLYVLHTRRYKPCKEGQPDDPCKGTDYPTKYPSDFFEALTTTYFFMSGRYGPVEDSFETGTVGFRFMMVIFFFFTVILLLNVLIALVNDAFNSSETEGTIAYWKLLSEVIAEMEMIPSYSEGATNNDSNCEYIYYCAGDEEVKKFESKSEISSFAETSEAAHKRTHEVQTLIINGINAVRLDVGQSKVDLKEAMDELKGQVGLINNDLKKETSESKGQAGPSNVDSKETTESKGQAGPGNADLKETTESKGQVEPSNADLKKEIDELKKLVLLLVSKQPGTEQPSTAQPDTHAIVATSDI
ncbi:MAG: hypothetical protein J3Q66DRAFT_435916 [Benniella sp.]|nr:MAG: hypothetical protein J3Q66DRAFT_435916 [Benniella sp.]